MGDPFAHGRGGAAGPSSECGDVMRWLYDGVMLVSLLSAVMLSIALGARWMAMRSCAAIQPIPQTAAAAASPFPCPSLPGGAALGTFTTEQFTDRDGLRLTYYLYLPPHYQPTQTYPVVLLLHGSGESAVAGAPPAQNRNTIIQQRYVQAWVTPAAQAQYPCIVVVPQASAGARWADESGDDGSTTTKGDLEPTSALTTAVGIVTTLEAQFSSVDPHRLYIVGISMGAQGVWAAVERWPWLFAAAAPLSGVGDPAQAVTLRRLPIWDFQGAQDATRLVTGSRGMYAAIHASGGSACYTEFPNQGHDLWNSVQVYQNPVFRQWLFSQMHVPSPVEQPLSCTGVSVDGAPAR